jgi:hypothetical protein
VRVGDLPRRPAFYKYPEPQRLLKAPINRRRRREVKTTLVTLFVAISMLGGVAGQAFAQTADEISPNDTKQFYNQMDRESRGGQGV